MLQAYCKQSWSVACLSYSEIFSTCRSGISDTSEVPFSRDPKSGDFCSPDQRLFPQLTINYSSRCYPILFPLPKIQPPSTFAFWRIRNALRNGETNLKILLPAGATWANMVQALFWPQLFLFWVSSKFITHLRYLIIWPTQTGLPSNCSLLPIAHGPWKVPYWAVQPSFNFSL